MTQIDAGHGLKIEYDRAKVIGRLIPFSFIPVILTAIGYGVVTGQLETRDDTPSQTLAIIGVGLLFWLGFFVYLVSGAIKPILLTIDRGGRATWNWGFGVKHVSLARGTHVRWDRAHVVVDPAPDGIFGFKPSGGKTAIPLPQRGLKPIPSGQFVIGHFD